VGPRGQDEAPEDFRDALLPGRIGALDIVLDYIAVLTKELGFGPERIRSFPRHGWPKLPTGILSQPG
jgi:hypothetical protein